MAVGQTEAPQEVQTIDVIRNKGYNSRMMTYATLQSDRREFLALTGLTLQEFQLLLNAFTPAYERRYPKDRTLADRPRQRCAGGGRKGVLDCPEQKLLFLLVYLKTYPLQVLMGELFGLSQPGVNYWIHRLLPVLRDALDSLSVLPERNPNDFARSQTATGTEPRLIIDGTERRRQRPKSPEKQALHYSGKKKAHTDKNVVIVDLRRKCIGFLSRTYVGKTHDKKIADSEGISYPPKAELYKDTGFQGYEPAVTRTCQAKKTRVAKLTGDTVAPTSRGSRPGHGESAVACADFHGVSPTPLAALANAPHSPATTADPSSGRSRVASPETSRAEPITTRPGEARRRPLDRRSW